MGSKTFAILAFAARHVRRFIGYGLLGIVVALAVLYGLYLRDLPDLMPWHEIHLDAEFRASDVDTVATLEDYRRREDWVFDQLDREIYAQAAPADPAPFNRFAAGSRSDPRRLPVNWNRTFELIPDEPRAGVLLLHGMSDSPYSMRGIAEVLRARGYHVVGLRLPGHGTAPSGLLWARWQDMAAAARLAMADLTRRLGPDRPVSIVGYSAGAALAVDYALARAQGEPLPPVDRLVLISPAIGITPVAALAVWQARLAVLIGEPKAAWTSLGVEYDPYKYVSFSVNAGDQVYRLTMEIGERLDALARTPGGAALPPTLAFQSVADATVSTPAVVDALFRRLRPGEHELVLFDINALALTAELFSPAATRVRQELLARPPLPFAVTVLANAGPNSDELVALHRPAGEAAIATRPTGLHWPSGVFSLSHVALPFPPDDPVYGQERPAAPTLIYLGNLVLRGERGQLAISPADLIRLRHNPFFDDMVARIVDFLEGSATEGRRPAGVRGTLIGAASPPVLPGVTAPPARRMIP